MSNPTVSRIHVNCDYCKADIRYFFKRIYYKSSWQKCTSQGEAETSGQLKLSFGKRPAEVDDNEQNKNIQKEINLEVDLNNSIDLYTDEGQTEGKTKGEPGPETESSNIASFVRALLEAKDEIKHDSKIRKLNDITANDEMFIAVNGPEIGEADGLLAKALKRK